MLNLVPIESLSDLVCITCKKVLSQFPIYCSTGGSTCGRCPYPQNGIKNEAYEVVAQKLKFPCCFNENGCLENLLPKDVPTHEKFCRFRKYDCPIICNPVCGWKGVAQDLLDHVEVKHCMLLLKDGRFEVDFVNNHNENYLLPYGDNLYIVNRRAVSKKHSFFCTVSYIGSDVSVEEFSYKIILESGNKNHSHEICNRMNATTQIDRDELSAILHDPTSIVAKIEVFLEETLNNNLKQDDHENQNLNLDLLRELECSVCFLYMTPPILQCLTGHSFCQTCKEKLSECPSCKKPFQNTQNFVLAQVIAHIDYPCKYSKCRFTAKAKDIRRHEENCTFTPHPCPLIDYENCSEEMMFDQMYEHIVNNHYESLLEIDCVSYPFSINDETGITDCFIIKYDSKLFKLHIEYEDCKFYFAAQLVGPPEEASDYRFCVDILDASKKNHRVYCTRNCGPMTHGDDAFEDGREFIVFTREQIKHLITDVIFFRAIIKNN